MKIDQMKTSKNQNRFLVMILMSAIDIVLASVSTSCNPGVLKEFGLCEQWACAQNCTCVERQDCHQYCDGKTCKDMRCLSPKICKQKVHLNGIVRPHVLNMFARASLVTQDCQGGTCDVMRAKGPKLNRRSKNQKRKNGKRKDGHRRGRAVSGGEREQMTSYAALQNCVSGVCKRLVSTLKISKQFCSHCDKVHCFGASATNCTQICASGKCKVMQCDSKHCEQACLQNSVCHMKCGKNAKTCLQVCALGSTCQMSCDAESCKQECGVNKECRILNRSPKTQKNTSTTVLPTTQGTPKTIDHSYTKDVYNTSKQSKTISFPASTTQNKTNSPTTTLPTTTNPATSTKNPTTSANEATTAYFRDLLQSTLGNEIPDVPKTIAENETKTVVVVDILKKSNDYSTRRGSSAGVLRTLDLRMFGSLTLIVFKLLILR